MAARIVLFHGVTLDGYIAEPDGGIGFLKQFDGVDYGYAAFAATVVVSVVGRKTFDQASAMIPAHRFPGERIVVVTSRPLPEQVLGTETYSGDVAALARRLRGEVDGVIWVVGGGQIVRQLINADEVDRIEHHVLPVLLGEGISAYDGTLGRTRLRHVETRDFDRGMVGLNYEVDARRSYVPFSAPK